MNPQSTGPPLHPVTAASAGALSLFVVSLAMAAVGADPDVDFFVDAGDGTDALANINAAGPGCKLLLGATHWLTI